MFLTFKTKGAYNMSSNVR